MAAEKPTPLRPDHDTERFDSGEPELDDWLRKRALRNDSEGASRTYVVCEAGSPRVVAYYCLATGAVLRNQAPGRISRNMPEPIPVMVLGRLAVDRSFAGRGLGSGLLRDAILRTLQAADIAGIRALLVHRSHRPRPRVLRAARVPLVANRSAHTHAAAERREANLGFGIEVSARKPTRGHGWASWGFDATRVPPSGVDSLTPSATRGTAAGT